MARPTCLEEIMESEDPLSGGTNLLGVKILEKTFREVWRTFQPTENTDVEEARNDFWSIEGTSILEFNKGSPGTFLGSALFVEEFGKYGSDGTAKLSGRDCRVREPT